jgi:pimeloyl-ACP methyl ester carboxylesterase
MTKNPDYEQVEHSGCRLSYRVSGNNGSPVLFIQGAGIHGDGWEPQTETLKSDYECLTFDNRGIGRSQPCSAPLSIEQMAEDARVLIDHLGWDNVHVVGHSMGGLIALHLALNTRERVRSLALLCTFARGRDATRLTARMMWIGLRTRIGTRRSRRHAFLEMVMPPETLSD